MRSGREEGAADDRDVDAAIEGLETAVADRALGLVELGREETEARIRELEGIVRNLCEEVVDRNDRIEELQRRLEEARELEERASASLGAAAEEVDRLRAEARGQATQIRMQALRFAARLAPGVVEKAGAVIGAAAEESAEPAPGSRDAAPAFAREPAVPRPGGEGVRLDIGPLASFDQLLRIEDALAGLEGASSVRVGRFSHGRATLDLRLEDRSELAARLAAACELELEHRSTEDDLIVLDVAGAGADAA